MKIYVEIQAETILNGGSIEDAEKIYEELLRGLNSKRGKTKKDAENNHCDSGV